MSYYYQIKKQLIIIKDLWNREGKFSFELIARMKNISEKHINKQGGQNL